MSQDWNRYGPTAASAAGAKPGRMVRPHSMAIGMHSHIAFPMVRQDYTNACANEQ
jgi:hypothetical protein